MPVIFLWNYRQRKPCSTIFFSKNDDTRTGHSHKSIVHINDIGGSNIKIYDWNQGWDFPAQNPFFRPKWVKLWLAVFPGFFQLSKTDEKYGGPCFKQGSFSKNVMYQIKIVQGRFWENFPTGYEPIIQIVWKFLLYFFIQVTRSGLTFARVCSWLHM